MMLPVTPGALEDSSGKTLGYGVYDKSGYWLRLNTGPFELTFGDMTVAASVAEAVNLAYEEGARSAREAMRDALGL